MTRGARSRLGPWLLLSAGLTMLGLASALRMSTLYPGVVHISWSDAVLSGLMDWYLWAPLAPLVLACARRLPLVGPGAWRGRLAHLVLGAAFSITQTALFTALTAWSRSSTFESELRSSLLIKFHAGVFVYWTAVLGIQAWSAHQRARGEELRRARLDKQLSDARLAVLQSHLRPHFLFNTMNSIAALLRRDPDAAERMLARLAQLLRTSLDRDGEATMALGEEIDFLRGYLEIEEARFGDRLRVEIDVGQGAEVAQVPRLLLQPLVENAIRHGIARRVEGGTVRLVARRANGRLELEVSDDGVGPEGEDLFSRGVGLSVTRERLALLYGSEASIDLWSSPTGGLRVVLSLPFEEAKESSA